MDDDTISRKAAVNALWKALYAYEDKTKKQFLESEDLDIYDWMVHRIFVQNMSDIDRRIILDLPSAERRGQWIKDKNLYKCTACNDFLSVAGWADCIPEKQIYTAFKHCPNCGARMEVKE